jgi:hypothetical protein
VGRAFLGGAVLLGAAGPAPASGPGLEPAIAVIAAPSGEDGTGRDKDHAGRILAARLGALGARLVRPAPAADAGGAKGIKVTTRPPHADDPGAADLVVAPRTTRALRRGAYTGHLQVTVGAALYPASGAPPRTLRITRQRRLPWACVEACAARHAARLAAEAAEDLAPGILKTARALVPVPARRLAFEGFSGREIAQARSYLRVFPGFHHMDGGRPLGGATVIRYASRLDDPSLGAALHRMLGHLGIRGRLARAGRRVTVTKDAGQPAPRDETREW